MVIKWNCALKNFSIKLLWKDYTVKGGKSDKEAFVYLKEGYCYGKEYFSLE